MNFKLFLNMVKRGLTNISRNKGMSIASASSVAATLVILGVVLVVIINVNGMAATTQEQFDQVQVYLNDGLETEQVEKIKEEIEKIDNVNGAEFVSKEDGLINMKESWGENGYLLDGIENENPLPNMFVVKIEDSETLNKVVTEMEQIEGITEVKYHEDIIVRLNKIAGFLRTGGVVVTGILIFVSVFIISNTIKVTVFARRKEIEIMKYVGATDGFIRGPFIVEGIVLGIVGTIIATIIIYLGYKYSFHILAKRWMNVVMSTYLINPADIIGDLSVMFLAIGVGIGTLGSVFSLKKHLDV